MYVHEHTSKIPTVGFLSALSCDTQYRGTQSSCIVQSQDVHEQPAQAGNRVDINEVYYYCPTTLVELKCVPAECLTLCILFSISKPMNGCGGIGGINLSEYYGNK